MHVANPNLLVVLGGLDFGLDLSRVALHPVVLNVPGKLVYAAHNYLWSCPACDNNHTAFVEKLENQWGFIMRNDIAPVWISEFGTPHTGDGYVDVGPQGRWWTWFTAYLKANHTGISFGYWPLDGTQSTGRTRIRGSEEIYGILNADWSAPYSMAHLEQILSLVDHPKHPAPAFDAKIGEL